jgi:hypothetical protein
MFQRCTFFDSIATMDTTTHNDDAANDAEINHQIRQKWGDAVGRGGLTGYLALPEALIRGQKRLGLSSTEMMVLINILMHWWKAERMPFPGNSAIAKRMGIDTRTVQRACATLEEKRLIRREVRRFHDDATDRHSAARTIHLEGLVSRLNDVAGDLVFYAQNVREERAAQKQP